MLPGAKLYAADVYGGGATGGSADSIARGLAWVADSGATVINVSLVGPSNRLVEAVVKALIGRGHVIVAAVGNDGPAKAVEYPAAYDGVIAVTSVDRNMHVQIDANRGPQISYAAIGVDVPVASLNRSYGRATGTSFASPVVAARFAWLMARPDPAAARRADERLQVQAIDLGAAGRDPVFGYGFLASTPLHTETVSFSKP
jgi:subtilisin family serine protease